MELLSRWLNWLKLTPECETGATSTLREVENSFSSGVSMSSSPGHQWGISLWPPRTSSCQAFQETPVLCPALLWADPERSWHRVEAAISTQASWRMALSDNGGSGDLQPSQSHPAEAVGTVLPSGVINLLAQAVSFRIVLHHQPWPAVYLFVTLEMKTESKLLISALSCDLLNQEPFLTPDIF